eukprot:17143-Heterococcus_DN1.PRE.1
MSRSELEGALLVANARAYSNAKMELALCLLQMLKLTVYIASVYMSLFYDRLNEFVASDDCNDVTISEQAAEISKLKQANAAAATRAVDSFVTAR